MRSATLLALLLLPLLLVPLMATNVSAMEHNVSYDSWSDFSHVTVWSNDTGSPVEMLNSSTWPSTEYVPVGTMLNHSTCTFWLNSSTNQRVDVLFVLEDNNVEVHSQQWLNTFFTWPGPRYFTFQSDELNITTVHGHTYDFEWHYRFHTIFWNTWLTGCSPLTDDAEAFILTVEEPVPATNTARWQYLTLLWYPGASAPNVYHTYPPTPKYATLYLDQGDAISGVQAYVLVGCVENVRLETECFFYVDTTLHGWDNDSDPLTPGYTPVALDYYSPLAFSYVVQGGVPYYFVLFFALYDSNNTLLAQDQYTFTMVVEPSPPVYVGWMDAIVWCAILFSPGLIAAHWIGRWGILIGIGAMAVVIILLDASMMLMSFLALLTVGVMSFSVRGE